MESVFLPKTFSTLKEADKFVEEAKKQGLTDNDFQMYKGKNIKGSKWRL